MANAPETYEIYAIKYAQRNAFRAEHFIFSDAHDVPMPMDYFIWAIVGKKASYVVDTGFEAEEARKRGRQLLRTPSEALQVIGLDAAKAEHVILTHMHYDHCGNLGMFPKAKLYLQEREMGYATGKYMREEVMRRPFCVDYVTDIVRALYDDRVEFVSGVREIAPGITVHHVGGHTDGLQVIRVWTKRGWVVVASDATHYYDNIFRTNPFPIVFNVGHMLEGYRTIHALAESPKHIIAGHDPLVMARFPAASKATQDIAVRVDVEPLHWE
jgi:glyoxylase-like metal-dependent hydrolase (beta-lactamase superfamily II)